MSIRKKYDFASVGELTEDVVSREKTRALADQELPIGIKVPVELGQSSDGLFKMHYDFESSIEDNFRNMLMTNHGERLGLYDFGANLAELAFELGAEDTDIEAVRRIKRTTSKYMPFIQLMTFEPLTESFDNEHVAKVGVRITYKVSALSDKTRQIEAIVFTAG